MVMSAYSLVALALIALSCSLVGCGTSQGDNFEDQAERYVGVDAYSDGNAVVSTALVVPANLDVWVSVNGASLLEYAGGYAELANGVEIQLHEGGPWIDVTDLFKQYWWDENSFVNYHPVQMYSITLTEPGEYVVLARVQYFDGVVVETDPMLSPKITVTEPEAPAGGESSDEEE
jgi:hypothetical protein